MFPKILAKQPESVRIAIGLGEALSRKLSSSAESFSLFHL